MAIGDVNEDGRRARWPASSTASRCALDVADAASVRAAVAAVDASSSGEIDVLVNNAGTDRFAFFVNTDEELWDFVLGVNLRGVLAVTHAVLPRHAGAPQRARSSTSPARPGASARRARPSTRPRRPA